MTADDEEAVIAALQAAVGTVAPPLVGIGDDAALVGGDLVVTTDTMVEGTHWDSRLSAEDVGWKLVAVNVSDLAAMGARPAWCVLALTLPGPLHLPWVEAFAAGVGAACRHWNLPLVGGDTTRGPARVATLTAAGNAPRPVRRSTARPGDLVWVSGPLGRAAEAFLSTTPSEAALAWFRRPQPPLALALALADAGAVSAMMDLSDGLQRDLARLCVASGCGATIDVDALPGAGPLAWRTAFGEDYELLFTTPPDTQDAVEYIAAPMSTRPTCIGRIEQAGGVRRLDGAPWPTPLYAHFPSRRGAS